MNTKILLTSRDLENVAGGIREEDNVLDEFQLILTDREEAERILLQNFLEETARRTRDETGFIPRDFIV